MRKFLFLIALLTPSIALADHASWLERCEPYRDTVQSILSAHGLSTDYYFLMVAESRCTPKARSSKGAQGFWQLTKATAKNYGCDDAHDLECATMAAARYLKHLERSFNSFERVIMAYNLGGHNLIKYGPTSEAKGLAWKVKELKRWHSVMAAEKGTE